MAPARTCWAAGPLRELVCLEGYGQWVCSCEVPLIVLSLGEEKGENRDGRCCVPRFRATAGCLGGAVQVQGRNVSSSHPFYGYFACITLS